MEDLEDAYDRSETPQQQSLTPPLQANVDGETLQAVALAMEQTRNTGDMEVVRGQLPSLAEQTDRLTAAFAHYYADVLR